MFSKAVQYGIQTMVHLAENRVDEPILVAQIAEANSIPAPFLAKVGRQLSRHHLVSATRGRGGGVRLSREPNEIMLRHIVCAIEGPQPDEPQCALGIDVCSDDVPCPLHDRWSVI